MELLRRPFNHEQAIRVLKLSECMNDQAMMMTKELAEHFLILQIRQLVQGWLKQCVVPSCSSVAHSSIPKPQSVSFVPGASVNPSFNFSGCTVNIQRTSC